MAARKPNDRTVASVVILTLNPISLSPGSFQMTGLADAQAHEKGVTLSGRPCRDEDSH
jgi:hypothetical protein